MPTKRAEDFEYLANDPNYVPDPEIEEFMEQEISRAPKDPELLAHRLRDNTAASPRDAGGDLDASWEDVNESGSETVAGAPWRSPPRNTRVWSMKYDMLPLFPYSTGTADT